MIRVSIGEPRRHSDALNKADQAARLALVGPTLYGQRFREWVVVESGGEQGRTTAGPAPVQR